MIRPARRETRRRGAVAVVVTLCLVPLIGIMAFAIDGGLMLATKRRTQTVSDAAAHAAACRLYANLTSDPTGLDVSGKARAAALLNASANGYSNDGTTSTVKINIPPTSGYFVGRAGYAELIVASIQPRLFGSVFGSGTLTITARSVARGIKSSSTPYSTASVIVLDPTSAGALTVAGSANVTTESTIQVNSSNAGAANANNAGYAKGSNIQIVGNYTTSSSGYFTTTSGSAVKTAAPVMSDPLAGLATPTTSGLPSQSFSSTYGSKTISPGVYNGGISMGNGMTISMLPGLYYMKGGGFSVAGGVTLTGNGVTIFMDNGGGQLNIQGGASVTLTPPTSGTYSGLTYFQDRASTQAISIANGSNQKIQGTLYAAGAAAVFAGGSNNILGSQIIVKTLNLSNNASIQVNTTTDAKSGYVASNAGGASSIAIVE